MNKTDTALTFRALPTRGNRLSYALGWFCLKRFGGWVIIGTLPDIKKGVIVIAPHTSNWDFFIGMFAMLALKVRLSFLGKHQIFVFPVKRILLKLGGIPVDRRSAHGVVPEMVQVFKRSEQLVLALAPEGTRSKVAQWRQGFLHIAKAAKVPVIPVAFDFFYREIRIGAPIQVETTQVALKAVQAFTAQAQGKHAELE